MKPFLVILLLAACCFAKEQSNHAYILPGKVALEWKFRDETRVWLEARSFNGDEWTQEGFHPGFTYIYVKDYIPTVKKIDANHYQITFHSEIAQDVP